MTKKFALFSKGNAAPFFCDKKFSHVEILIDDGFQYTILNPTSIGFKYYVTVYESDSKLEEKYSENGYSVIDFSNLKTDYKFGLKFNIMTCVEFAKYIIGLRSFFVFTPFQLRKKLLKLNCEEINHG